MKKSNFIALVLITASLASCHKEEKKDKKVYMRSDSSASYSQTHHTSSGLWFYAFRPYGYHNGFSYARSGYYSSGISEHSNVGHNSTKSSVVRGGFGGRGFSVSS